MKKGPALLIGAMRGSFLEVGLVVSPADFEAASGSWARYANAIAQINLDVRAYQQRPRPWLRKKKGRGAQ
jgi:hypothetical protein